MDQYEPFFVKAAKLAGAIDTHRDRIIAELGRYETYDAARDEVERSISALHGVRAEMAAVKSGVTDLTICTFFPLNLPLYSLILFAVIPAAFAENVYVRAPEIMQDVMKLLSEMLGIDTLFPQLKIKQLGRTAFLELYAKAADVILFTGRYENALIIQKSCPQALFIFNGGGVNPAVVYQDADVELAARKIFEMRTFNSGQDCAGTDAVFVHSKVIDRFKSYIETHIAAAVTGPYGVSATEIGPILKKEYITSLQSFIHKEDARITHRGSVDEDSGIVTPYVISKPSDQHKGEFHEFFAPVFYLLEFSDEKQVLAHLNNPIISDYSMYISYFSAQDHLSEITYARLLKNHIINDVEQGNSEYGGYGKKANFVAFASELICRPILISREIDSFLLSDNIS